MSSPQSIVAGGTIALQYSVRRGDFALHVDENIPAVGITGLFGESGSGKTTLLRCIAGLEKRGNGDTTPVHQRRIGYVFQEPQLFPHLNVRRNVEFGLRRAGDGALDKEHVIDMFGLGGLLGRRPHELSGGEAQRVAIAAVLLRSPSLMLMDEPLASLDQRRKDELLPYLDRLHEELSLPIIYVSHSIDEVSRLCDHLLLIDGGRIIANGELHETLVRLDIPMLSGRNAGAVLDARPKSYDSQYDLTEFHFSGGVLLAPGRHDTNTSTSRLRIAASDVSLCRTPPQDSTILNILPAVIDEIRLSDSSTSLIRLRAGDDFLVAQVTQRSVAGLNLAHGDDVYAQVKSVTVKRQGSNIAST
jgi:molybdate transport system ATP-binding protein